MSIEAIRKELKQAEKSKESNIIELNDMRKNLIEKFKPYMKQELKSIVENQVKSKSEHTKSLAKDQLKQMKNDLNALLDSSDELVDSTFADDTIWIHINYEVDTDKRDYGDLYNNQKVAKNNIEAGIRRIMGSAGKILVDNKYVNPSPAYSTATSGPWTLTKNDKVIYSYGIALPRDIDDLLDKYKNKLGDLHNDVENITKLSKSLAEQEAMDLWDEI